MRRFKAQAVSREDVLAVLECADWAPSAMNRQPWEFLVASGSWIERLGESYRQVVDGFTRGWADDDKDRLMSRPELLRFASGYGGAPVIIVVLVPRRGDPYEAKAGLEGASAAMENLVLAAADRGLGTCWMTGPLRDEPAFRRIPGIPDDREVVALTPLGYPEKMPAPRPGPAPRWSARCGGWNKHERKGRPQRICSRGKHLLCGERMRTKVIIMGAAGRDFHDFNTFFRDNQDYEVVAFTAAQIPHIDERRYPAPLAGKLYPEGIPIRPEEELESLIRENGVQQVVFAYSDVSHLDLMHTASKVLGWGADFRLMGNERIRCKAGVPVISVCAVRTGSGKSPTTRKVCGILKGMGLRVVAIRHPMPYGDLVKQECERFADYGDLDKYETTIEEREEYEPLLDNGIVVYAGVDYEKILRAAEKEADVIVWDGGNNDFSFYQSDLQIVIADPHRPGHEMSYYPGETNARTADVVIINKVQTADRKDILTVKENITRLNPKALIIEAASPITVDLPELVTGKRVLVVEDGPTVTHGGMAFGAGLIAAEDLRAAEIVDPRKYAVGSIARTFAKYPHLTKVLPAMGYSPEQVKELKETIDRADCQAVVTGTPIDIRRVVEVNKPVVRARYEVAEIGRPDLKDVITQWYAGYRGR